MISDKREWTQSRDALVNAITSLGYPVEFGKEIATWRQKKEAEEANARYNDMVYHGLWDSEQAAGLDDGGMRRWKSL